MSSKEADREIAIYWDYENVTLPQWCGPAEASKRIYNAVSRYGRVVERRLYFDYLRHGAGGGCSHDCSGLDLSGFDLVNTPSRNSKETLDKKLIADVLTFAWDCAARNDARKPCVVLITSDGDYAYVLAKLRDRGVMNVVMFGRDCSVAQILVENADVALSFEKDVLGASTPSKNMPKYEKCSIGTPTVSTQWKAGWNIGNGKPPAGFDLAVRNVFFKNIPPAVNAKDFAQFVERACKAPVERAVMECINPHFSFAHVQFVSAKDGAAVLESASLNGLPFRGRNLVARVDTRVPTAAVLARTEESLFYERPRSVPRAARISRGPEPPISHAGDLLLCCVCLRNDQVRLNTLAQDEGKGFEKFWVPMSPFIGGLKGALERREDSPGPSNQSRSALDSAIHARYITVGRQRLDDKEAHVGVAWHLNRGMHEDLSAEAYLRLTEKGRLEVRKTFGKKNVVEFLSPFDAPREMISGEDEPSDTLGTFLVFLNLPRSMNARGVVEQIQNSCQAPVERAVVTHQATDDIASNESDSKCCAHVQLANASDGLAIIFRARTEGIVFGELRIGVVARGNRASISNLEAGSESCYVRPDHASSVTNDGENSSSSTKADLCTALCYCILHEQVVFGNENIFPFEQCWVTYRSLGTALQRTAPYRDIPKESCREILKIVREISISVGLVEVGRREKTKPGKLGRYVRVPRFESQSRPDSLSQVLYLRLTSAGLKLIHLRTRKLRTQEKDASRVYLKNLPWPVRVVDVVRFLEEDAGCVVRRAIIEHREPNDGCVARVQLVDVKDGMRICCNGSSLDFSGRTVRAEIDTRPPLEDSIPEQESSLFYERGEDDSLGEDVESSSSAFLTTEGSSTRVGEDPNATNAAVTTDGVDIASIILACSQSNASPLQNGDANKLSCVENEASAVLDGCFPSQLGTHGGNSRTMRHGSDSGAERNADANDLPRARDGGNATEIEDGDRNPVGNAPLVSRVVSRVTLDSCFPSEPGTHDGNSQTMQLEARSQNSGTEQNADSNDFSCVWDEVSANRIEDNERSPDVDAALVSQVIQQTGFSSEPGNNDGISRLQSEIALLEKELTEAIGSKDFAKAGTVQARIGRLEEEARGDEKVDRALKKELDEQLEEAVETRNFARAGVIQTRVESMESGVLSALEIGAMIATELEEELRGAVLAKDFVRAGTIQTRIDRISHVAPCAAQSK